MLLESVPRLDPHGERDRLAALTLRGETPSAIERAEGCVFLSRCPAAQPACGQSSPGTEQAGESQQVACWRWRELGN